MAPPFPVSTAPPQRTTRHLAAPRHSSTVEVAVEESYPHCPRALEFSRLWDEATIAANRAAPPVTR